MKEKKLPKIIIVTAVYARATSEQKAIIGAITALNKLEIPIIAVCRKNPKFPIENILKKLKWVELRYGESLDEQMRDGFKHAAKIGDAIFYLESDKVDFARHNAAKFIKEYLKQPKSFCAAGRTTKSFNLYPEFQKKMEKFLWVATSELLKFKHLKDLTFGPRIFPSSLVPCLKGFKTRGFGVQYSLVSLAQKTGLPIQVVKFDVKPPEDVQKGRELSLFRIGQMEECLEGLREGYLYLYARQKSKDY